MKMASRLQILGTLALSLLALGGLAACGGDNMSNSDLLKAALQNDSAIKSFHLEMEMSQGGMVMKISGDSDVANKKLKSTLTMLGSTNNLIKVGDKLYKSKDGTNWEEANAMEAGIVEGFFSIFAGIKAEKVDAIKDKLKDGSPSTEKIEGVDTRHMTMSAQDMSALGQNNLSADVTGSADIWVSTGSNPVIRRLKITGQKGSSPIEATLTRSKIDEPVAIEAPTVDPSIANAALLTSASIYMSDLAQLRNFYIDADLSIAGQPVKLTGDVAGRGSLSFKLDMTSGGKKTQIIREAFSGDYVTADNGQSFKPASESEVAPIIDLLTRFDEMWAKTDLLSRDDLKGKLKDGSPATETIDGVSTKHMVASISDLEALGLGMGAPSGTVGELHIWVDTEDKGKPETFVRRVRLAGKSGGQDIKGTIEWSAFGKDPEITVPEEKIARTLNYKLLEAAKDAMFLASVGGTGSYQVDAELTSGGETAQIKGVLAPFIYRFDMTLGGQQTQVISLFPEYYVSADAGQTFILVGKEEAEKLNDRFKQIIEMWNVLGGVFNYEANELEAALKDGSPATEIIDGINCKHIVAPLEFFAGEAELFGPDDTTGELHFWINAEGPPLVRQVTIDGKSSAGDVKGTIKWSRFGEDFKIEAPAIYTPAPLPSPTKP